MVARIGRPIGRWYDILDAVDQPSCTTDQAGSAVNMAFAQRIGQVARHRLAAGQIQQWRVERRRV